MDQHRALHRGFGDPCIVKKKSVSYLSLPIAFLKDFLQILKVTTGNILVLVIERFMVDRIVT